MVPARLGRRTFLRGSQLAGFDLVVANEDGRVLPLGRGPAANLRLIRTLAGNGYAAEAADLLESSLEAYPADPALRAMSSTRGPVAK